MLKFAKKRQKRSLKGYFTTWSVFSEFKRRDLKIISSNKKIIIAFADFKENIYFL